MNCGVTFGASDAIGLAARLVRAAPQNCGGPLPTWKELEAIGDLMREAAVFIRRSHDDAKKCGLIPPHGPIQ